MPFCTQCARSVVEGVQTSPKIVHFVMSVSSWAQSTPPCRGFEARAHLHGLMVRADSVNHLYKIEVFLGPAIAVQERVQPDTRNAGFSARGLFSGSDS